MTASESPEERPWVRQPLAVPRSDRSLFARPPLAETDALLESNRALFAEADPSLQGRSLQRMRQWTRDAVLAAARDYTRELRGRDINPADPAAPLIVGGHQPALFHPGVWAKNFAVGRLAARAGGIGLHLIVDNDVLTGTRAVVPAGTREHPTFDTIPIDAEQRAKPWEEARVIDPAVLASFGRRATEAMARWGLVPMAASHWQHAIAGANRTGLLREAFTTVRHHIENEWGLSNLELPLSRLCTLDPFLWFASHILAQLPRFRETYNTVLAEYRAVNGVRSRTHPVPDLGETDGWLEAPFWVWRAGDRLRGRLHAKQSGRQVILSDGRDEIARLRLAPDMDACCAVEGLRELAPQGIRFRTRALTTTLFARLCLSDVFVHGIGGAKYDEMTDRLFTRFYGVPSPDFLTLSATVLLPAAEPFDVSAGDARRVEGLLRDLRWNSDRHITPGFDPSADALIAERKRLAEEQQTDLATPVAIGTRRARRRERVARYHRLKEVAARLAEFTADQRADAESELASVRSHLTANRVLRNREYSFLLYPEKTLRPFLTGVMSDANATA